MRGKGLSLFCHFVSMLSVHCRRHQNWFFVVHGHCLDGFYWPIWYKPIKSVKVIESDICMNLSLNLFYSDEAGLRSCKWLEEKYWGSGCVVVSRPRIHCLARDILQAALWLFWGVNDLLISGGGSGTSSSSLI